MPQASREISASYYARSRLGVANMACFCWGCGLPVEGRWIVLSSRVLEKPEEFSWACLDKICSMLDLSETKWLTFWSDVGPHYRCYKLLSSLGTIMSEKCRLHIAVNYGAESHMKHICDGFFSTLNSELSAKISQPKTEISTIADLISVYTDGGNIRRSLDELAPH